MQYRPSPVLKIVMTDSAGTDFREQSVEIIHCLSSRKRAPGFRPSALMSCEAKGPGQASSSMSDFGVEMQVRQEPLSTSALGSVL